MKPLFIIPLLLLSAMAVSGTFSFDTPFNLQCAGTNIDVGYYASPCVVDWDGDGLKDLVTGQYTSGLIRFYMNEGTNQNPVFNSFSYLQADGTLISMGAS